MWSLCTKYGGFLVCFPIFTILPSCLQPPETFMCFKKPVCMKKSKHRGYQTIRKLCSLKKLKAKNVNIVKDPKALASQKKLTNNFHYNFTDQPSCMLKKKLVKMVHHKPNFSAHKLSKVMYYVVNLSRNNNWTLCKSATKDFLIWKNMSWFNESFLFKAKLSEILSGMMAIL